MPDIDTTNVQVSQVEEDPQGAANRAVIDDRLDQALSAMQAHVSRGTFTAAQRDAAILLVLRVCIGVVRLLRRRLDAVD